jgi:diguanylate cyclase (GGDEF)-like protein
MPRPSGAPTLPLAACAARETSAPVRREAVRGDDPVDRLVHELVVENQRLRAQIELLEGANRRLARLSVTDELTGLPNHRSFRESLQRELKRALRSREELSLVLFDVDDFKALNDGYGHSVGDAILARLAAVMRAQLREADLLARYGGEEFALLAPGTGIDGAVALAEKIRLAVSATAYSVLSLDGARSLGVTLSAGVARYAGDERALFNDADRALYGAKEAGKDCVVAAEPVTSTPP